MGIYDQTNASPFSGDPIFNSSGNVDLDIAITSGSTVAGDFEFEDVFNFGYSVITENYQFSITSGAEFGTLAFDENTGEWSFESNGTAAFEDSVEITVSGSGLYNDGAFGVTPYTDEDTITLTFVCFTRGAEVATENGTTKIEDITPGMLVPTLEHGLQPVRWIGSRKMRAAGENAPIVFAEGALGNTREMRVSPGHRMLITGWRAETLFGTSEVLVAAKDLVNSDTIYRAEGGDVEYYHILFDQHEIITVDGAPSESFHPAQTGLNNVDISTREEVLRLFPEIRKDAQAYGKPARAALGIAEAKLLH